MAREAGGSVGRRVRAWLLTSGVLATGALVGGRARTDESAAADPSTQEMAALLREQAAKVDPAKLGFIVNDRRATLFGEALAWPRPITERLNLRTMYAAELLNSGRSADSLQEIGKLEEHARTIAPAWWSTNHSEVAVRKAMAYLRMGEEQNCHQGNTRDSCLLPIRGTGIHQKREGSTRAIEILNAVLEADPANLRARWLLNVAHMTVDSYPDGVTPSQLIPPAAFASQYPLPRFTNVAREAGLDLSGISGGAILDDFDHDGRLDLVVSNIGFEDQMRFFRNRGDGTFEERTTQAGLTGEVGGLNLVQADFDNDGFVDILVLRGGWLGTEGRFPMSLLRNDGHGRFTDVTKAAGLLSHLAPTQTATWFDYDGDGWLDLFVGNETMPNSEPKDISPCELFHNEGNGTFTSVARETGVDVVAWVKGVVSGDYDNDGRPDLYLSLKGGANLLLHNGGPAKAGSERSWIFTNVAATAGVTEPRHSFGAFFFDYDNDGWPDLFVAGYGVFGGSNLATDTAADYLGLPFTGERGRLYHNRGDGTFEDVTKAAGLYRFIPAMGLNFGDLDNDGWLDFYLGTGDPDFSALVPNRMFRNAEGRSFQDVTTAGNFGHLQKGHAIAFGDVDNDGDQDIFEEMGGAFTADKAMSVLYENPGNANHWVSLELEGVRSNRGAIGARIKVSLETKSGPRILYRTVSSGGSFGGSPLRQEIGLGDARRITGVLVFWPATGSTQKIEGLALDRRYLIREGAATSVRLERPRFKLGPSAKANDPPAGLGHDGGRKGRAVHEGGSAPQPGMLFERNHDHLGLPGFRDEGLLP
jgi:FG-GAP-like repeat/ASPIC and UnbV